MRVGGSKGGIKVRVVRNPTPNRRLCYFEVAIARLGVARSWSACQQKRDCDRNFELSSLREQDYEIEVKLISGAVHSRRTATHSHLIDFLFCKLKQTDFFSYLAEI